MNVTETNRKLRLIFLTHHKIGVGQVLISATNAVTFLNVLQFVLNRNWR